MLMPRVKKMTSLALNPALLARLDAWLKKQEFPPSKTAAFEKALEEFLDARDPPRKGGR